MSKELLIGFIGQGFIGKNYANDFENRGYSVIRYAKEEPYINNQEKIKDCDIVFIAVPTPTIPEGFDDHIVRDVIKLVGDGKVAVIKSTILPGTTESIQAENPRLYVLHSPEFLTEATARYDSDNPDRNIIGIPLLTEEYRAVAESVLSVLPEAPYNSICGAREAELVKYGGNNFFYVKVVFMNLLYDLTQGLGADWRVVRDALVADPRIGKIHMDPVHKSGRGAGGHCLIKDFAAMSDLYKKTVRNDIVGIKLLDGLKEKNLELLLSSNKDLDLVEGVYGPVGLGGVMSLSSVEESEDLTPVSHELINTLAQG